MLSEVLFGEGCQKKKKKKMSRQHEQAFRVTHFVYDSLSFRICIEDQSAVRSNYRRKTEEPTPVEVLVREPTRYERRTAMDCM